jgi:hypothetical protein
MHGAATCIVISQRVFVSASAGAGTEALSPKLGICFCDYLQVVLAPATRHGH